MGRLLQSVKLNYGGVGTHVKERIVDLAHCRAGIASNRRSSGPVNDPIVNQPPQLAALARETRELLPRASGRAIALHHYR